MSYTGLKHRYSTETEVEYVQLMQSNQMKRGNKSVTLWTRNQPSQLRVNDQISSSIWPLTGRNRRTGKRGSATRFESGQPWFKSGQPWFELGQL